MFHTFAPAEEKIEKEEFESAEATFTKWILTALAIIGASGASKDMKDECRKLVKAPCEEVRTLEAGGNRMIDSASVIDKQLWKDMKKLKENAPCSRSVLAGTTYSGSSGDYSPVTPADIGKKIEEQRAEEEAKQLKVQKEHEGEQWMLEILKTNHGALLGIIEENANKNWETDEQEEFWRKKQQLAQKYKEQVEKVVITNQNREDELNAIIKYVFKTFQLFAAAISVVMVLDFVQRLKR